MQGREAEDLRVDAEHLAGVVGIGRPVPVAHDVPDRRGALREEAVERRRGGARLQAIERRDRRIDELGGTTRGVGVVAQVLKLRARTPSRGVGNMIPWPPHESQLPIPA